MKLGLIGIGELGSAIAKNMIKAGHGLHVYDSQPEAVAKAEALGAKPANSSLALAARVEALITALPTPTIIRTIPRSFVEHFRGDGRGTHPALCLGLSPLGF